jgi:gamma-glutamylcyclotransferase (GGCT)/AIG2-like uncharacterized protein YtfP
MAVKYSKYFAYGSNMSLTMLDKMGVRYKNVMPAVLHHYELVFSVPDNEKKDFGFASVVPNKDAVVKGLVMEVEEQSIAILDEYEAFPNDYLKENVEVELLKGEKVNCFMYVGHPNIVKEGLKPWSGHWEIVCEIHAQYF